MALVVVASTAATARTSTAAGTSSSATTWTTSAATPGAAIAALSLGASFVDIQRSSAELLTIQCCDGLFGFRRVCHLHEGETSRTAGLAVEP